MTAPVPPITHQFDTDALVSVVVQYIVSQVGGSHGAEDIEKVAGPLVRGMLLSSLTLYQRSRHLAELYERWLEQDLADSDSLMARGTGGALHLVALTPSTGTAGDL